MEGQTLSAGKGTWSGSPTSYAYQWAQCNTAGEGCSSIAGASAAMFAPGRILLLRTLEDLFKRLPGRVVEFCTNADADLLARQVVGPTNDETVGVRNVDAEQLAPASPVDDPDAAAHERIPFRAARKRDHDALPGSPGRGDVVVPPVLIQCGVYAVREPQQRDFPQGRQVARRKIVSQRALSLLTSTSKNSWYNY